VAYHDDEEAEPLSDDAEFPDEADMDEDDGEELAETAPCPYCKEPLYEQAERCPHCGRYIAQNEGRGRKAIWILIAAIACLVAVFMWMR